MVSVSATSLQWCTFKVELEDLKCMFKKVLMGVQGGACMVSCGGKGIFGSVS